MSNKNNKDKNIDIGMYEFHRFYKQESGEKISRGLFGKIAKQFFLLVMEEICKGFIFELPHKLGRIGIEKYKPRIIFDENGFNLQKSNVSIDFGATNKLWRDNPELKHKKYIYHTNEHTGGYKYKIKWSKKGAAVKNIRRYKFNPSRVFSREKLANYVTQNPDAVYWDF